MDDAIPMIPPGLLYGGIALAVALFAIAIALERRRRTRAERARQAASWNMAREIATQRRLSDAQWRRLQAAIENWGPKEPHSALTVRRDFDRCVAAYLEGLGKDEAAEAGAELRVARERLALNAPPGSRRLFTTREIEPGAVLWLGDGRGGPRVRATVLDVDEARLQVIPESSLPEGTQALEGASISCAMRRPDDGLYAFHLPVLHVEGKPLTLFLGHTDELERTQQREYFRVRYDIETEMGVARKRAGQEDVLEEEPAYSVKARLRDVSAGGFSAVVDGELPERAWLMFDLDVTAELDLDLEEEETPPMEELGPLQLTARIIEVKPITGGRRLVRGEFVGIDPETRDLLARFVLQRQQRDLQEEDPWE